MTEQLTGGGRKDMVEFMAAEACVQDFLHSHKTEQRAGGSW